MNYRELQQACKDKGINAKGSKAELIERLEKATTVTVEVPLGDNPRKFVFTGDPWNPGTDPAWVSAHGYMFKLNGRPIEVDDDAAKRLYNNSHFTEK